MMMRSGAVLGPIWLVLASGCLSPGNGQRADRLAAVGRAAVETASSGGEASLPSRDQDAVDEQPYAMTISGGVSLGAYEAGLNWAVVELMRNHTPQQQPRLLGVTGASAGSINALLTAIRWCEVQTTTTVDDNLFADTWLPVGFDTLLPGRDDAYYEDGEEWPQDLLLSRKSAFAEIIGKVDEALDRRVYRDGCSLKLGLTVTSKSPRVLALRGLRVGNQRFVVPLVTSVKGGRIRFTVDTEIETNERKDLLGNLLFLAPVARDGNSYVVAHKDVIRAALASSAYPMAFGPVDLPYCAPRSECPDEDRDRDATRNELCRQLGSDLQMREGVACRRRFIDGGVFDNVPLGVAMAQIESSLPARRTPATHRPLHYVYMYPGNRRQPEKRAMDGEQCQPGRARVAAPADLLRDQGPRRATPLQDTIDFLGGAIDTASEYELHNVLRYNLWNAGTPQLATAVAEILDPSLICPQAQLPIRRAEDRELAATLTAVAGEAPVDPTRAARALLGASRTLERIASGATGRSSEELERTRNAYRLLRQSILDAVVSICGNGNGTTNGASGPCGTAAREVLGQTTALLHDPRNERHLMLSRRFSPITGTHIAHFGAFLDRPFRDYDYHAGIYDALWSVADISCKIQQAREAGISSDEVKQDARGMPVDTEPVQMPRDCLRAEFDRARQRLGLVPGSLAHRLTERLWRAEHADQLPTGGGTQVDKIMTALFDPQRCREADLHAGMKGSPDHASMCLRDLDLPAFAKALSRADYQAHGDNPFVRWVMDHPEGGWWALPGVFAAGRLLDLARAEGMSKVSLASAIAESYLESYVDQHSTSVFVAPSSLPDRKVTRWAGLLFPFAALSLHPTRRIELGLLRGGIRMGPRADLSGWGRLLPWDLLGELSARVTVRRRRADEDDQGYGLFTRGSTTLHASFAPTLRIGGILWSFGLRVGTPVPIGPLRSQIPYKDQINTEVVATFLGDKLRFAVGCNPLQDPPGDRCWRDLYYSFGVNDMAGLAYWTGLNPYKPKRLFIPFVAARVTTDVPSAEIGLVRAGWQPWPALGIWADASLVTGSESTGNASVAYEAEIVEDRWRVGLRGGYPLSIRDDARVKASNLELVLTVPYGLRLAAGAFPFDVAKDDVRWFDASYISLGWDPGSLALRMLRWFR